jgi:hypothetical protein
MQPGGFFFESLENRHLLSATPVPAAWAGYAANPQHTAISSAPSQNLKKLKWHTQVDLNPQFSGDELLIHYGSPVITAKNTVIVPVKTSASGIAAPTANSFGSNRRITSCPQVSGHPNSAPPSPPPAGSISPAPAAPFTGATAPTPPPEKPDKSPSTA